MADQRNHDEIRIRGVAPSMKQDINNIAGNLGITVTDFLKPKLREIVDQAPEHLKRPLNFLD